MKIETVKDSITFKSGYPTFGTGHLIYKPNTFDTVLSAKPDIYDNIYIGYKDDEEQREGQRLNYLA